MEWYQYLRDERARKINALQRLLSGDLSTVGNRGGERIDTSVETVERMRRNIAEIEQILVAAGVPLEEETIIVLE